MKAEEIHIKMLRAKFNLIFAKKDLKVDPDKSEKLLTEALVYLNEGLNLSRAQIENELLQIKLSKYNQQFVESKSCKCPICEDTLNKDYTCPNPNCPEYGC